MRGSWNLLLAYLISLPLMAADLAPTGTLRATFLGSNPVQGKVDPQTGAVTGPVADLVKELARRLGVPYTIIPGANAAEVTAHLKAHTADIGFLAYDETRAKEVDFSKSYALMHNTYIVRADSDIKKAGDADRKGVRVGAVKGQTQEIYLSSNLKNAQVKVFPTMPAPEELHQILMNRELDAFGANRQRMTDLASRFPNLRALNDDFSAVEQSVVVEKGDPSKLEVINRFLDEVRASGFVKASLERAKLDGVDVATGQSR